MPDERDSVKCVYCGSDIVVREAIQAGTGINIQNILTLGKSAYKSQNYEEAYNYFSKVLEVDLKNAEAWYGKAKSAGWRFTFADFRIPEITSGFDNAISYISNEKKQALKAQCAESVLEISQAYSSLTGSHLAEYPRVDGACSDYFNRCANIISFLEYGYGLNSKNEDIVLGILSICKNNIEGVQYEAWSDLTESWEKRICHPSANYANFLGTKWNTYTQKERELDSSFQTPEIKIKKSSCCFVITATMGNRYHPYVITLQHFRDSWLAKRSSGRTFNKYYYRYGPYLADLIRDRNTLRIISLHLLVKPSVWIASNLLKRQKTNIIEN